MMLWFSLRCASRAVRESGPGLRPLFAGAGGGGFSGLTREASEARVDGRGAYGRSGGSGREDVDAGAVGAEAAEEGDVAGMGGRFCRRPGVELPVVPVPLLELLLILSLLWGVDWISLSVILKAGE